MLVEFPHASIMRGGLVKPVPHCCGALRLPSRLHAFVRVAATVFVAAVRASFPQIDKHVKVHSLLMGCPRVTVCCCEMWSGKASTTSSRCPLPFLRDSRSCPDDIYPARRCFCQTRRSQCFSDHAS